MTTIDDIAAPAAWYPDPGNDPVLRWWDGSSWTAHTREAASNAQADAPVGQVQPAAFETVRPATAAPVLLWDPVDPQPEAAAPSRNGQKALTDGSGTSQPEGFVPRSTFRPLPNVVLAAPLRSPDSVWSWGFALVPVLQAAVLLVVLLGGGSVPVGVAFLALAVFPTAAQIVLATRDAAVVRDRGYRSVEWTWALSAPLYLIVRAVRLGRSGTAPLAVWLGACLIPLVVAAVLVSTVVRDTRAIERYERGAPSSSVASALTAAERSALLTPEGMASWLAIDLAASGDTVEDVDCPPFDPLDAAIVSCSATIAGMDAEARLQITDHYSTAAFVLVGFGWE